ncbi:ketopantoate reductase family protein [Aquabacter spiritensis]|uniref:2-dehydropantoate 2-reductase n=1 Tax=Aquabacter spiritensis TaxID=933073 RepID=A0A4R3M3F2_9HYPH|nr:ketopantoate reductase family protein [Aquabacter spiritensis]TCT06759.1 ketopantoate reductase [Aquabacter spiritensis]
MRILSLGAGALGGYFGGRLVEAGADVTFLVRQRRRAQLQAQGLAIRSAACGDFVCSSVRAIAQDELDDEAPFDVALLTCKAYDLEDAMAAIEPAIEGGAAILPLLNGLSHMEVLNARYGRERVLGGLAKIAATVTTDGTILHLNDWRYLVFGEQDGSISARCSALKATFDGSSVEASLVDNVVGRMWEKFVHLATVASMTCLMRASVGEIARTPRGSAQMTSMLETLAGLAAEAGYPVSEDFKTEYRRLFHDASSSYTASMLRDLESGKRVEADHIVGYAADRMRQFGIDAPLLEAAHTHLKAYEERRAAGRL